MRELELVCLSQTVVILVEYSLLKLLLVCTIIDVNFLF